jgi:hypothetical protein
MGERALQIILTKQEKCHCSFAGILVTATASGGP